MITSVDSNVLVDIFIDDKQFGKSSAQALQKCLNDGAVFVSGVVMVETMPLFATETDYFDTLFQLTVKCVTMNLQSYVCAALAWKEYRVNGGPRNRAAADFLIGAHALVECDRLLTRDRGFYRTYFRKLNVLEP